MRLLLNFYAFSIRQSIITILRCKDDDGAARKEDEGTEMRNHLFVLVREDLFAALAAGHPVLLLLAELRRGELGLLLRAFDLVAHGIELVFLIGILGETGTGTLTLHPVVAGRRL